jgi:putative DNA primase/helicase
VAALQEPLRNRTQGRWRSILPALGLSEAFLTGKNGPCPWCAGRDRWRFINREGSGNWICSQCGKGDGLALAVRVAGLDFAGTAKLIEAVLGETIVKREPPRKEVSRDAMRRMWAEAQPIAGTPGEIYFHGRGLAAPPCLRYSPRVWHAKDAASPAILAKVAAPNGRCVNLYRIFVTKEGLRAPIEKPKRMMMAPVAVGSAVRLGHEMRTLGVAEGIENALAASAMFGEVVWATLGTEFMERFEAPEGVEELVIYGDNDKSFAGQKAAYALAHRAAVGTIHVRVEIPPTPGADWNDILMEKRAGR